MPKPRLKRFERAEVADPLKLQPRDIALLRNAAEFRFLNTPQIFALHPGGKRNLSRRLTALYQHGYLDRPQSQTSARLLSPRKGKVKTICGNAKKLRASIKRGETSSPEPTNRRVSENRSDNLPPAENRLTKLSIITGY